MTFLTAEVWIYSDDIRCEGGKSQSSTASTTSTTDTQQSATGTVGSVAQIAAGATLNNTTTDFGAISGAAAVGNNAINALATGTQTVLANDSQNTANLFNFVAATEQGASDLVNKAITLAASSSGASQGTISQLGNPAPSPNSVTTAFSQIDIAKLSPWVIGGVVAYFYFSKKGK